MRIITISREFGSGGRELGELIAKKLGFAYFDREIITTVAERSQMDEHYVEAVLDRGMFRELHITYGHSIAHTSTITHTARQIIEEQHKIINEIAEAGDCVIVGRNADVFLAEHEPLKLFVYATDEAKLARCRERAPEDEHLSDKALKRSIKRINRARGRTHAFYSDIPWGDKRGYHLCVNTTDVDIEVLANILADYAKHWFEE
ncbi:MAG: cytidylate kinase-like family protein [Ruminococcaceae bacterium]|nr:cytidylate kinase-like family protein [Oscillospiraceae bacterium]